jgi:hypothetical protein
MNRTPMKPGRGFSRKQYEPPPRAPLVRVEGVRATMSVKVRELVAVPKDVRTLPPGDEPRLWVHVRSLECGRCWREGRTQVSHSNQLIDGKGRGLKAYPWRVAALCDLCHVVIDQGKELSKSERLAEWERAHRWTVGELFSRGLVKPV